MNSLVETAPAFVEMAHQIVWASVATVDAAGAPTSRILHPYWVWDGTALVGWIGTANAAVKGRHLAANPNVSVSYWAPNHDTCTAHGTATFVSDAEKRTWLWESLKAAPPPLGFDPGMIPGWDDPSSEGFQALRIEPTRLRVFPGTMLLRGEGTVYNWRA
jgi:general stress protein 26